MGTPGDPRDVESRLTQVEDAVQRATFVHLAAVDEETHGMAALYAQMFRRQQEMAAVQAQLAEILRRLPG